MLQYLQNLALAVITCMEVIWTVTHKQDKLVCGPRHTTHETVSTPNTMMNMTTYNH